MVDEGEFDRASVSDLAEAADVSRPTFYFYFASKRDLLARLVGLALEDVAASLAHELDRMPGSPAVRLRKAITHGADTWWENRAVMGSALELAATEPDIYDHMMTTFQPVNALCVELLMKHGTVPEARSVTAATELVAALAMMNERVLAHVLRSARIREDLRPTERQLLKIWTRAMGLRQNRA